MEWLLACVRKCAPRRGASINGSSPLISAARSATRAGAMAPTLAFIAASCFVQTLLIYLIVSGSVATDEPGQC